MQLNLTRLRRTLVFTATDTTSGAMSRLLHLLAQHPEVQNKLVEEITAQGEQPDYDTLTSLPYMDAVIRETLRVYVLRTVQGWKLILTFFRFPPIPMVFRQ